ncbi:hypothetical protein AK812_SmicGene18912 [Symbiodinium microadriaticum]|uniref:Uncharacterized protein n=1 Tax=Symbiodinium microadriaticum TaxID=2951 RepID=A0A1Q9DTZ8_SYMMI|nr:hypothetical protein AK812_SmicGene18912 [Symbiodinium microadriaticum]
MATSNGKYRPAVRALAEKLANEESPGDQQRTGSGDAPVTTVEDRDEPTGRSLKRRRLQLEISIIRELEKMTYAHKRGVSRASIRCQARLLGDACDVRESDDDQWQVLTSLMAHRIGTVFWPIIAIATGLVSVHAHIRSDAPRPPSTIIRYLISSPDRTDKYLSKDYPHSSQRKKSTVPPSKNRYERIDLI